MIVITALVAVLSSNAADTINVATLMAAPTLDGRITPNEYGPPTLHVVTTNGNVPVWIARHGGYVYIAATIADSSVYWGDDFVISLDPRGGMRTGVPAGARQWYLRRTLDSSIVSIAPENGSGRWYIDEPPPLGARRDDKTWSVASTSTPRGWSLELRISESAFKSSGELPRVALRTYNDSPRGWWSWPAPGQGTPAQRVERSAELWAYVLLR